MAKYIHTITKKLPYDHKVYFDRAAFSFLSGCEKILDLGCGTGRFISQDPARIKGLDLNDLSHIRPYNPRVILKYLTPSQQRTFPHISDDYQLISLKWRYKQFNLNRIYINLIGYAINQLQVPILPKTGYLLVMGKRSLIR